MNRFASIFALICSLLVALASGCLSDDGTVPPLDLPFDGDDSSLQIQGVEARYVAALDAVVFELEVVGDAASIAPAPAGQLDGAPVLGYVFPTTLAPSAVGFGDVAGTLALAVTSHPDFDDTPLWDEDDNEVYDDDGVVYHAHWVVLYPDTRAPAGLAVVQGDDASSLPPTAPMPMYLDSPGFTVVEQGAHLRVVVPADRIQRNLDFRVGALVAFMRVDASAAPLLAVHAVLSQAADGTATTPVANASAAPSHAWPTPANDEGTFDIVGTTASYDPTVETFTLSMELAGMAATYVPEAAGQVDGAPVVGYVFPTNIAPAEIGFRATAGILALAVTSHPDFDDTPLWDEDLDLDYENDGSTYHVHWVLLTEDETSTGGLTVPSQADPSLLPPTAPMGLYLDSPGYNAFASGNHLHVLIPGSHLRSIQEFSYDAVTARMHVDASGAGPVIRVDEVVEVLSGDLSLPFAVSREPIVAD